MILSCFAGFVIGLLSYIYSFWLLFFLLVPCAWLFFFKKSGAKSFLPILFCLTAILLILVFPKGEAGSVETAGIVIERKDTYVILLTLKGRYLVYDRSGTYNLFTVLKIEGYSQTASFSHYESGFDFASYLESKGVFNILTPYTTEVLFDSPFDMTPLKEWTFSYLNDSATSLTDSLLFGASLSDYESYDTLTSLGITSLFSLGGFHISFLVALVEKLLSRSKKKWTWYINIFILVFFMVISSFRFAVRRILLIKIVDRVTKNKMNNVDSLCISCFILLLFEPYTIISSSFYYPIPFLFYLRLFRKKEARKQGKLFFTLTVFLFFLPYRMIDDYGLNLLSLLAQIVFIPLTHLFFMISILTMVCPFIGYVLNLIASLIDFMSAAVENVSLFVVTGRLSIIVIFLFYFFLCLYQVFNIYEMKTEKKVSLVTAICILSVNVIPSPLPVYAIHFVDVGQGDCTLIQYGYSAIMIDTGGLYYADLATECLIPYMQSLKIYSLDALIITHYDYDHYGARDSLIENFNVKAVYDYSAFLAEEDNTLEIAGLEIENLNDYYISSDTNDLSAVYDFTIKGTRCLIMGDAPAEVEEAILEEGKNVDADIIKLGHHGSNTSSSYDFLEAVSPELAIISCGTNNSYGHPHSETLETLDTLGIEYRRTDLEGTISYHF